MKKTRFLVFFIWIFVEEGFSEEQMGEAFVQWLEREIFEKDGKKS